MKSTRCNERAPLRLWSFRRAGRGCGGRTYASRFRAHHDHEHVEIKVWGHMENVWGAARSLARLSRAIMLKICRGVAVSGSARVRRRKSWPTNLVAKHVCDFPSGYGR